ncbi:MAG TPA: maleylpyruvate isomerase N-terminal domain-containing protein [Iamia sp.]
MAETVAFTVDDLEAVGELALAAWGSAVDRDWSVPAGTLEWTCLATADHTIDCVFSYALFLASRKEDGYPAFDLLRALPEAGPADMLDGLRAVVGMLAAVIRTAPPDARATLFGGGGHPVVTGPAPFAPRGGLELALHAHDVCSGLGVEFEPPAGVGARLLAATDGWPGAGAGFTPTGDAWADLLVRSGRPSPR